MSDWIIGSCTEMARLWFLAKVRSNSQAVRFDELGPIIAGERGSLLVCPDNDAEKRLLLSQGKL